MTKKYVTHEDVMDAAKEIGPAAREAFDRWMNAPLLTAAHLQEIRDRCEKATLGPWEPDEHERYVHQQGGKYRCICEGNPFMKRHHGYENITFIAAARSDVPALLDHIAAQDAEIDRLRIIEREYHGHLLTQIQNMRHEGEGSDTVYFSDGNQVSVAILEKLEAAELLERVGSIGGGETGHIFGRLIPAGTQMMEGEPK